MRASTNLQAIIRNSPVLRRQVEDDRYDAPVGEPIYRRKEEKEITKRRRRQDGYAMRCHTCHIQLPLTRICDTCGEV